MPHDATQIYMQNLRKKLDAAAAQALPLALAAEFDAAEEMIRDVERDIYGLLAMSRMYIAAIAALGGPNAEPHDRDRIRALFERAVKHRENAYPMPHTKEEADAYEEGRSQDRGDVIREIGFDPHQWPNDSA